mgnify:FL=1
MALVINKVFADAINAKLGVSLRIGSIAFDATSMAPEIMTAGDEVHFPSFDRIDDAETVTQGTALTAEELAMTDNTATIKQIGKAVRVYDKNANQIKGATMDRMVEQVTQVMQKAIDSDLVAAMDTDATKKEAVAGATTITSAELMSGIGLFGDDIDTESFAGIVINSRLYPTLVAMPEFTSIEKTYATAGNGMVANGLCGYWLGIPVIVCNNNTYDTSKAECKTYIAKKNALGYVFQKDISVEEARQALLLATDIVSSSLYATKLIDKDGVVVLRKTIA